MSAWIVSKTTIDLLVQAGLTFPKYDNMRWNLPTTGDRFGELTISNANEVGAMLWTENVRSVAHRYPGDLPGFRPGPNDFKDEDAAAYTYEALPGRITPVVVAKSLSCYEYQSCEHPGWRTSEAREFCQALRDRVLSSLPGYEEAPWGLDDRRYFVTQVKA